MVVKFAFAKPAFLGVMQKEIRIAKQAESDYVGAERFWA